MVTAAGPALYLVVGKESFLKQEFLRSLRAEFFSKGTEHGNTRDFYAQEQSLGEVLDFLRTAPFLAEKRMAIFFEIETLSAEAQKEILSKAVSLPSTAILVCVAEDGTPKKSAFLKDLSLKTSLVSCYLPKEHELPSWIRDRAKKKGLKVPTDVCRFLAERMGEDAASLVQSIEQLALNISPRETAELKDAVALFGYPSKRSVFDFTDILLKKDAVNALRSFETLFDEGTDPAEILPLLAAQIDRLRRTRSLIDRGWSENEIAGHLKIHPFYLKDTVRQASGVSQETSRNIFKRLLVCEEAIKTGQSAPRIAFERFIAEVCGY